MSHDLIRGFPMREFGTRKLANGELERYRKKPIPFPIEREHPLYMRGRFRDGEIEQYMTSEVAAICGYKRGIDVDRTLDLNRHNVVIEQIGRAHV